MDSLVACVPNFSEGRRSDIIQQIIDALESVAGVRILDVQSDADHNRTVVTMAGSPEQIEEAAFRGIKLASELIDMDKHHGEHPRLGATDVVPFVPFRGITVEECVRIAQRLGQRVAEELDIPIYLYEAAATRPERTNLADVRRGEYEGIKDAIETDPDRKPDFGPSRLGSAGATVIGVRPFLVAFNVYLNTDDVAIAKRIARAVRHSSGGLRYVKALGLLVGGKAQVSMNLTDFARTPLHRVMEMIRRETANCGASITHSEIVGLVPQQALVDAAAWYLQCDVEAAQVFENRLQDDTDLTPHAFLRAVASGEPAPGGGSAAALAGALAAALAEMVGQLTLGRKKYESVQDEMRGLVKEVEQLRLSLTARVAQDAAAYDQVVAAYRLPKQSADEKAAREKAIQQAIAHAAEVPLATARESIATMSLAQKALSHGNINALSDAGSAIHLARAAFEGAALNVRINAGQIEDDLLKNEWLTEIAHLRADCSRIFDDSLEMLEVKWTEM